MLAYGTTRRVAQSLTVLRFAVATLLFIHGAYRASVNGPAGFGPWLGEQGIPFGVAVAWLITIVEIVGTLSIMAGRFVRPFALWFAIELSVGIVLVHAPEGWFVVGAGRNGMEYSVLLVTAMLAIAWAGTPGRGD